MLATAISGLVAAIGATFPWPLSPVVEPLGGLQHSQTEFYRGFGVSESVIQGDNAGNTAANNILAACYNIASRLDEHVSGCWTGRYSGLLGSWYDHVDGECISSVDGNVNHDDGHYYLPEGGSIFDQYLDDNGLEGNQIDAFDCQQICSGQTRCTATSFINGVCKFYKFAKATGQGHAENCQESGTCQTCMVKHFDEEVFQIYVAYTSECEDCIAIEASEFVTDGGEVLATFDQLRKFPGTAFDSNTEPIPTASPPVTNALEALEARVSALETTTASAATSVSSTTTTPTTVFTKIYVKPAERDDTEFGRGIVDVFYTTAAVTSPTGAVRVTFGQIGELSRAFCEVACTRDIQCTGYSTPSTPFGQAGQSEIPPDYPCLLLTPHETHLGATAAAVKTLVVAGDTVYQKQYSRLDPESFYGSRRFTRWAFVRKSLLTTSNILVPFEGEDGVTTIEECGSRCAADNDCFQAIWITPWQPCYKTPVGEEIFYGSPQCPVASDPSTRIVHDGDNDVIQVGELECADETQDGFLSGGQFALVLNLYGYAGLPPDIVNADDLGAQRRFWKDPFVRCDADCQARCGDGSEFLRLVPVRVEADPPDQDAANTLTITIHDCPDVVEIEVERADPSHNNGRLSVVFGEKSLADLPRLRKFTWLQFDVGNDQFFESIVYAGDPSVGLSSCVQYTANEVLLDGWIVYSAELRDVAGKFLGVVANFNDGEQEEEVYGFPTDAKTFHCIPCDPDPEAVFSGGRGGGLENVKIVSHRFFSECPGITEAVAPALLYPNVGGTFNEGTANEIIVNAWKYQPRSPYLERLTIPTTDQIIGSDKVVSSRIDDADAGTTEYTLQPCAETDLTVETFRESNSGHHILDANKFRGCLMESVTISTTSPLRIREGAFIDNPNLFRVTLENSGGNHDSEIEAGAFEFPGSISDLFVAGGTTTNINNELNRISASVGGFPSRQGQQQYVGCRNAFRRAGCFPAALDTSTFTTAVGVTSPACGPGTYNIGPLVDVLHESDHSMDILGMTRIKIVRPEDEAEKTVQVPTGRLSTMCQPVGALPSDSASAYTGFPALDPLPVAGDSGRLPDRMPAHIADPSNGLPVWATLLVGLGSAAVLFGGFTLVSRRKSVRV